MGKFVIVRFFEARNVQNQIGIHAIEYPMKNSLLTVFYKFPTHNFSHFHPIMHRKTANLLIGFVEKKLWRQATADLFCFNNAGGAVRERTVFAQRAMSTLTYTIDLR